MSTLVREPIDVSVLVSAKTGDILRKLMWLVRNWHIFYKAFARDTKIAIEFGRWRGCVALKESILSTRNV